MLEFSVDLQEELQSYLSRPSQHGGRELDLNNQRLNYYYGFGSKPWPTLDEAGEAAQEKVTKQRVDQLIRSYIRTAPISQLPTATRLANHLESLAPMEWGETHSKLCAMRLLPARCSAPGVLILLKDLGRCSALELFDVNLKRITRSTYAHARQVFIVDKDSAARIASHLGYLQGLPGKLGIAELPKKADSLSEVELQFVERLLAAREDVWISSETGRTWFLLHDKRNPLINDLYKIHSIAGRSELERSQLAEVLSHSIRRSGLPTAPIEVIDQYLQACPLVRSTSASKIQFLPSASAEALTPFEADTVSFLKNSPSCSADFRTLYDHLVRKGHKESTSANMIGRLPVVFVDRSNRPRIYRLIGSAWSELPARGRLNDLEQDIAEIINSPETERMEMMRCRIGQGKFRATLIERRKRCYVTRIESPTFLRASHIKPWCECSPEERLNSSNGLLLAPHYDFLFDRALISFEDDGRILVSESINHELVECFGLDRAFQGEPFDDETKLFLRIHRARFYEQQDD